MTHNISTHLIANNIVIDGELPFEIGGGVTLRRPSQAELDKFREILKGSSGSLVYPMVPYETVITSVDEREGVDFYQSENPSDWHYYVLSDDVGGNAVYRLSDALLLLEPSIELSVRLTSTGTSGNQIFGYSLPPPHIHERYYYPRNVSQRDTLSLDEFRRAEDIRLKLMSLDEKYEFVSYALRTMSELRRVSQYSRLQVIGLFSVIENLVTHKARLKESLDSISHQLQGKLRLLTNMAGCRELLSQHFDAMSDTNVWKKLYDYRSDIAHGSKTDFNSGFSALKSNESVVQFLYSFTKVILLFALENPQFMSDLKEC
jgi:hypothetical protein